jgi:hypothetical protein
MVLMEMFTLRGGAADWRRGLEGGSLRDCGRWAIAGAVMAGAMMMCSGGQKPAYATVRTNAATSDSTEAKEVAAKAVQLADEVHGIWSAMPGSAMPAFQMPGPPMPWSRKPGSIATGLMTPGALVGNGSVGVAIGGSPDHQEFYVGRNDFWSVLRGRIMPVGRLELTVAALQGASAKVSENVGPADVTANFVEGADALESRTWVANGHNLFAIELRNSSSQSLGVQAALLDGFGSSDAKTLSGTTGNVHWLRVSPETVHASIGGSRAGNGAAPDLSIRSVQVYAGEPASEAAQKLLYAWSSQTVLAGGDGLGSFSCGNVILPLRHFTVRATINVDGADGAGSIFSAMVGQQWMKQPIDPTDPLGNQRGHDLPRKQGAAAGLAIYLSHGRLAANLNGTVVTSSQTLPTRKWVTVTVSYNGQKLVLLADGKQTAATTNFPTAAEVMGPQWEWAAAHPGDVKLPFDGIGPEGVLAMRVVGGDATLSNGKMHFTIPAGGRVVVLVAAMDNRDTAAYFQVALSDLKQASLHDVAANWSRHLAWWRNFWSKSYIEVPDKTVQSWWYGSLYVLASCSEPGNVAPGLWGNWITSTHMAWQGDYTLDYNYQAPFWAAYPTNHVSLADPYDAPLLAWRKRGEGLAAKLHAHGVVYYTHLAPSPGWSADNFRALDQKSDALFAAVNCVQRWRYTRDAAYARKVWPFLTGVAEYWDHDLKRVNGRYVDLSDAADEHLWGSSSGVNPATTIGFLRMLYPALIDMSEQLHADEHQRATWNRFFSHLSELPIAPANSVPAIRKAVGKPIPPNQMVILQSQHGMQWVNLAWGGQLGPEPAVRPTGSSAGMNSLQVVFPGWNIGLESPPALRSAAWNTVHYTRLWYDNNDTSSFYPAAADSGYDPESILKHLHLLVTHIGYPSFAYAMPAGGVENEATVPTTIAAMLLQSYQQDIHVFPDWPLTEDASFGDLLAVGDFLVSSRLQGGHVVYVRITSQRGGFCRLANPWGANGSVALKVAGEKTAVLHGAVLTIPTHAGEQLTFTGHAR